MPQPPRVFNTDRRIRLGIWGLGRGMSFFRTCAFLNLDVVAGCDFNAHMRDGFSANCPGAQVTADAEEFLSWDFDAVLLATFCPAHADDAIRCLRAGKHVLSEVTAFHTMAEGVRLVEAVEKSGLVYNLAENYPFGAPHMYLARKWKEGLFGELMYAEYEYVHECRSLAYTYIDGVPVQPGWTVHNWRSWLNFHYYCTHSLGPVMVITGTRPTRVVSLPCEQPLAGYLMGSREGMGGVTPSLIHMSNGGLVRNLMGATTNDTHVQRLWGTLGSAEVNVGKSLQLRLGASGGSPKFEVTPSWDALGELAATTGHGGGDFWVLYYFARQILTGESAPFDIYSACDVTSPGILAYRSSIEDGTPYEVPDFRDRRARQQWRDDHFDQPRYDAARGVFPARANRDETCHFAKTMKDLIHYAQIARAYRDWAKVQAEMVQPEKLLELGNAVLQALAPMRDTYAMARKLADAYPKSDGARVLNQMLAIGEEAEIMAAAFPATLKRELARLTRRYGRADSQILQVGQASPLLPKATDITRVRPPPATLKFKPIPFDPNGRFLDIRPIHENRLDGLIYVRAIVNMPKAGKGTLYYHADGPFRVWCNGKPVGTDAHATNPAVPDKYRAEVTWKKGRNTVLFAVHTNRGRAWCVLGRATLA